MELGTKPHYATEYFSSRHKLNNLRKIITNSIENQKNVEDPKPILIDNDIEVFACILEMNKIVQYTFARGRKGYIHLISGEM